jgi:diacylglycerol kinase family enzyme
VSSEGQPRRITVILNKGSGSAERCLAIKDRLLEIFCNHGMAADFRVVTGVEIPGIAEAAIKAGCAAVVAGGGDGTVNAVASALVDIDVPLGILPAGTLNHFAKDLGIPLDLEQAAETIATGQVCRVDAAEVNRRVFVNNSSIGLYPYIVKGREREERLGKSKWVALLWATLAVMRRRPRMTVRVATDCGLEIMRRTPLVFVGNNRYQITGFQIGKRTALDRGELAVYIAHHNRSLLRMAIEAFFGKLRGGRDFDFLSTKQLTIETPRPVIEVATDGEVWNMVPPLLYRTRPHSLEVIVPWSQ